MVCLVSGPIFPKNSVDCSFILPLSDTTIKYGPYANIAPFSESEMVIHAENNNHMLVVNQLLR